MKNKIKIILPALTLIGLCAILTLQTTAQEFRELPNAQPESPERRMQQLREIDEQIEKLGKCRSCTLAWRQASIRQNNVIGTEIFSMHTEHSTPC